MFRKFAIFSDTMALMIVLWLCSLPLIALVILPLFGRTAAFTVALLLLPILLLFCWGICGWQMLDNRR
jgi:hypothetical protein